MTLSRKMLLREAAIFSVVVLSVFGLAELTCQFILEWFVGDWRRLIVYTVFGLFAGYCGAKINNHWTKRTYRKLEAEPKETAWVDWPLLHIFPLDPLLRGCEIMIDGRRGRIVDQNDKAIKVEWDR